MDDEVDRLVRGWRRALPGVDVSPLEVLSRGPRLARHLDRQRTLVLARHDLEIWSFDVLSALRRADAPGHLSPGQLLAQTLVSSGTMTNRLDHLEKRALCPATARSFRRPVGARPDHRGGQAPLDGALADLVEREQAILGSLDDGERTVLSGLLRQVVAPFDA